VFHSWPPWRLSSWVRDFHEGDTSLGDNIGGGLVLGDWPRTRGCVFDDTMLVDESSSPAEFSTPWLVLGSSCPGLLCQEGIQCFRFLLGHETGWW